MAICFYFMRREVQTNLRMNESDSEMQSRIEMERQGYACFSEICLNLNRLVRLLKCNVWRILLFGSDASSLNVSMLNKLENYQLRCDQKIF